MAPALALCLICLLALTIHEAAANAARDGNQGGKRGEGEESVRCSEEEEGKRGREERAAEDIVDLPVQFTEAPQLPPGIKSKPVPRVKARLEGGFADKLAARDRPAVLLDSPAREWRAFKEWDVDYIANNIAIPTPAGRSIDGIKRSTGNNGTFFYCHQGPLLSKEVTAYRESCYTMVAMEPAEFADLVRGKTTSLHDCSYSGKMDLASVELQMGTYPRDAFTVAAGERFEVLDDIRETSLWFGPAGSVTPLHFDLSHNFYVQVLGQKHFILFPPESAINLCPYPLLHPGAQSCQVDPLVPDLAQFPEATDLYAYTATLSAGDVLYIPPLWMHHVTSLSASASVSVWSHSKVTRLYEEAVDKYTPPFRVEWNAQERVVALRLFFESLGAALTLDPWTNLADFINTVLLESRYKYVALASTGVSYCLDADLEAKLFGIASDLMRPALTQLAAIFSAILAQGGVARRDTFLANFLEVTAFPVVGQDIRAFLHDFLYC